MKKLRFLIVAILAMACVGLFAACSDKPDDTPVTYTITVVGGTADKTTAEAGETITLTVGTIPDGKEFSAWKVNGETIEGNTFTMPAKDVNAEATYKTVSATVYSVTVTGGTADKTSAAAGATITLTTGEVPANKAFSHWTVNGEKIDGNTFEMPAANAEVKAVYVDVYTVTVTGGTADKTTAVAGETITLTVGELPDDKAFSHWTVNGEKIDGNTFEMPAANADVKAVYVTGYEISVTGGTADKTVAGEGDTVTLTLGEVPENKAFSHWTINGTKIEGNTFVMPAADAVVVAVYVDTYTITVTGGTADKTSAVAGDTITLTAGAAQAGYEFSHWTVNGEEIDGNTFEMPAEAVEVEAVYTKINYTVTVTGGTADKQTAQLGDTVTLTPDVDTEEKVFVYWTVNGSRIEGNTYEMGTANIECVAVFIDLVQKIATPDNTDSKLIYKETGEAIAFDRSGTTMFTEATDSVIYWIYTSADATEAIGHLVFRELASGKGELTTSDGSESVEVNGKAGNFYVDVNGNAYNRFHNLLKSELGFKYGEGIRYYFAAQIIAKTDKVTVEGVEVTFTDSEISEIGATPIVKDANKPSEYVTITVTGGTINGTLTTLTLGSGNRVTLSAPHKDGYLFVGWFEVDEEGEKIGEAIKVEMEFDYIVNESVNLLAEYVEESAVEKTALATPDNSGSNLIQKAANGAIEFDRRKGEDGTTKLTMFTAETAYVVYYIYTSPDADKADYIGQFRLRVKFNESAAGGTAFTGWIENMDGTDSREYVRGPLGDYYIDGSNANEFYNLLKGILGYDYSEGQTYYYAVQAIAAEGTIYENSEISEIGSVGFAQDASKGNERYTVKVLGDAKIDGTETEITAGYGVKITLTAEMPDGMDLFLGWKPVTLGNDSEEILGSAVSFDLTYVMTVTSTVTLRAVFANSSEITAEKLEAPDNSNNQMISFNGAITEYDRQKNDDESNKTALGAGVDYVIYYIYESDEADAQPVATFKLMRGDENKGYFLADNGTRFELMGELGNLYYTDGNAHNFIKNTVYKNATGKDWDNNGTYYFACQSIADGSGLYVNSDIGAKGQAWGAI